MILTRGPLRGEGRCPCGAEGMSVLLVGGPAEVVIRVRLFVAHIRLAASTSACTFGMGCSV
jgi:hypothetical protein